MLRILVVDDESDIRAGIIRKIEQMEREDVVVCGEAANGIEALQWLDEWHADLCVTDIRMPEMDGLQLARSVHERFPWVECMIVSSYGDFNYAKRAMQMNISEYVLKPVDREELEQAVLKSMSAIRRKRMNRAHQLIIEQFPSSGDMLKRWSEQLKTFQVDQYPILVVDMLQMMEKWVDDAYYLLDYAAEAWMQTLVKELGLPDAIREPARDGDMGIAESKLRARDRRYYFRLCAAWRMEQDMIGLIERQRDKGSAHYERMIAEIKTYMKQHYHEKLRLEQLAGLIPISRSYLAILFKQVTGMTVWEYLVNIRMKEAKRMLAEPSSKIYEVACRVGYENGEHFTKLFKEKFGMTPKEYRDCLVLPSGGDGPRI